MPAEARESSLVPLYCYSDSNKHQGSRVPSHFFGSKDTSSNAGLLLISGLQTGDEAVGSHSGSDDKEVRQNPWASDFGSEPGFSEKFP